MQDDKRQGALAGLRVIDASRVLAGPFCGQILADHGAEVIKIESPEGDECRGFGPPFVDGSAAYFRAVNRNKRSLVIDLNQPAERAVFWQLLETADVLIENFKASTLQTWGVDDPATLAKRYPQLVHCRITGFGDDGPLGRLPGYDAAVQAAAGLLSINGEAGGPPVRLGVPVVDLTTGMNGAIGVLLALQARHRTGRGQLVDIALYDSAVSVAHPFLANYLASDITPAPSGNSHPNIVPYDVYQTATYPLFVAVANDRLFRKLCAALGKPALADDPRFASNGNRVSNRQALDAILREAFAAFDGETLGPALLAQNVPAAPILDVAAVAQAPHTHHRRMVVQQDGYHGPGIPVKLSDTPGTIRHGAPALGDLALSEVQGVGSTSHTS